MRVILGTSVLGALPLLPDGPGHLLCRSALINAGLLTKQTHSPILEGLPVFG